MASIYKRGRVWWINWKNSCGHRNCESLKTGDKNIAIRLKKQYEIEEKRASLHGITTTAINLQAYQNEYLRARTGQLAPATVVRYQQALQSLLDYVGDIPLDRIRPQHIENWRNEYIKTRSTASGNCLLRHVKAALNYAVEHEYLMTSPARYVRSIRETSKPLRILSRDEVAELLAGVPPAMDKLIRTALYTGGRAGELCRLEPGDLDINIPAITIRSTSAAPTKSGKSRMVPVPDSTLSFFRDLQEQADNNRLLLDPAGYHWTVDKIAGYFRRLAKKQKVTCTFHDLRRTYGAWLVMAGVDLVTVQLNLGHSDISVTVKHYAQVVDSHRTAQVNRLPVI